MTVMELLNCAGMDIADVRRMESELRSLRNNEAYSYDGSVMVELGDLIRLLEQIQQAAIA